MENDPLGVDPEEMRRLGYQTVDLLALMDEIPAMAARVSRTARDRLPGL